MGMAAMTPYGRALLDYLRGDPSATIVVHRDDGHADNLPAGVFFRKPVAFSPIEQAALDLCRGHVLDIGAGTGCHSLALQERGVKVLAIDVSPEALQILAERGVAERQQANVFEFQGGPFDTLLLMMHGIGMVGDLPGLDRFLDHAHTLLNPDGQLLFDSLDVRCTDEPVHLAYHDANRQAGRYFGEIRLQFEYRGRKGPPFGWLHVDPGTLAARAEALGWSCRVVRQEENGNYVAQLVPVRQR